MFYRKTIDFFCAVVGANLYKNRRARFAKKYARLCRKNALESWKKDKQVILDELRL